jgi:hypothetical protein
VHVLVQDTCQFCDFSFTFTLSAYSSAFLIISVHGANQRNTSSIQSSCCVTFRTCRELGLICHEPTWLEIAAERAMLKYLLTPEEPSEDKQLSDAEEQPSPHSSADSGQPSKESIPLSSSKRSSKGLPSSAPTLQGISSITGLPLLPSFAIACHAAFDPHDGLLSIDGLVASEDGRMMHRVKLSGGAGAAEDAEQIGRDLGLQLREVALQHGWV